MIQGMITGEQIRGARGMLDWKQSDLAARTGLSLPSINAIEHMTSSPRLSTLILIQNVLENAGIEFIGTVGVQKHKEVFEMKQFEGDDFINRLNQDLFYCMSGPEDVVMMFGLDERMYPKYAPDSLIPYREHQEKTGFQERIILKENDDFMLSPTNSYRWASPGSVGLVPYYLYKDRVALIMWEKKRVILTRSQDIADSFRAQFEFLWSQAKAVPKNSVNKMDDPDYREKMKKSKKQKSDN